MFVNAWFAVLAGLALSGILRACGLARAYRFGIPVATFTARRDDMVRMIYGTSDEVRVERRPHCLLLTEIPPRFRASRFLGYLDHRGDQIRVSFIADASMSMGWLTLALVVVLPVVSVLSGLPTASGPEIGGALATTFAAAAGLIYSVRWARRRVRALAEHVGFPVSAPAV